VKPIVIDQNAIRSENRKRILQLLLRERELTILEMSQRLDISIPTVTKNINQFIAEGIAKEAGTSISTGGRRPAIIRFLPNAYYSIGIEFSAERAIRIVLADLDSHINDSHSFVCSDFHDMSAVMALIHQQIADMLRGQNIPLRQVLGIGFALPGTVNEDRKFLHTAPNLGISKIVFSDYEPLFELPIFVENDANAAVMAELALGGLPAMKNIVFLSVLPRSISGGIVVGGHLYHGCNKRAGEFSHIAIALDGPACSCGRKGCWETFASINALLGIFQEQTGVSVTIDELFTRVNACDAAAQQALDRYAYYVAVGIRNILLIQDPHYLILGGALSRFEEEFLPLLRDKIFTGHAILRQEDVQIVCASLKEDAAILGAALLPMEKIYTAHE